MKKIFYIAIFLMSLHVQAQTRNFALYSSMTDYFMLDNGDTTHFWGYGVYIHPTIQLEPTLPAPLLKAYKGESVTVKFVNLTGEDHTIHLHGTDASQRNDGVPHTWYAVDPNDSIPYSFDADYPGSFLYHCHVMTVHHLAMGMYGMIIIKNYPDTTKLYDGGPGFNKEYQYLFSDGDTGWFAAPTSPGELHDFHANYFMVNGKSSWMTFGAEDIINAQPGDSIAVHFGNIGYNTIRLNFPPQLNAKVYMSDGRVLPNSFFTDTLRLSPGERYEVIFRPTTAFNGYIDVAYLNAIMEHEMGMNYIGVNSYVHPIGVKEEPKLLKQLEIYPNPAATHFNLTVSQNGKGYLIDPHGKIIRQYNLESGNNKIDVSQVKAGGYIFYSKEGVCKIIISR